MRFTRSEQQHNAAARLATATLLVLVVGSCSDPGTNNGAAVATPAPTTATITVGQNTSVEPIAPEPTSVPVPHTSGVPRVEESKCAATIPTDSRVKCLTLVVPESRRITAADPTRLVRLPVVIIAAKDPSQRLPDPVLWIDYDAGDGFVANRARNFTEESLAINKNRDVVTLDLRGSGLAEPSLACPEVTSLNTGAFAATVDETSPEGRTMRLDAIKQCHDRLVADGVDLSAYASEDAAQDLEDLRVALGLKQWNIVAGEYGSKLAQILARDYPDGVRTVVVNSTPIPLQADWFADLAANADGAWTSLVAKCKADAGCAQAFPDLANRLAGDVADLASKPRHYDAVTLDGGDAKPFLMTADRLLSSVRSYGRDSNSIGQIPMSIAGPPGSPAQSLQTFDPDNPATLKFQASDAYYGGAWGLWEPFPQNADGSLGSYAFGAHLSAVCRDEAPFTDSARLATAAKVPLFGQFLGRHADLEACDVWAVDPAPAEANEAVHSNVPFLVLAGDLDPVSSPAWADAFADSSNAAQIVRFPYLTTQPTGGALSTAQTCARQLRDAFLAAPTAPLDQTCVSTSHGVAFDVP
jgi:pimeloyl-ACP methyl ester carboxylesterase